ncbi:MAG: hypothetical protein VXX85_00915 [Candidatus Margulisiibacteriota bacterium]|nr:hypothetical protein [Candidatus Margulisiibacteriota bacterium]
MPSIFNTDKINIMTLVSKVFKYILISLIFISIGSQVLQTQAFVNISIRGSYEVSQFMELEQVPHQYSGVVYLSTINKVGTGGGYSLTESSFSELVGKETTKIEEMEEGSYSCNTLTESTCLTKFMWEGDNDWEEGIFSQTSTSATNIKGFSGQINLSWKETVRNLRENGYALVPFIPNANNPQFSGFKVGFRGNPEKGFGGVARYKKDWDRNDRYGVGAFIIAIPAKGHFISSLKIRGLDAACTDASCTGYFEYSSPIESPYCSSAQCLLDIDNDFMTNSGNSNWFTPGDQDAANWGEDTISNKEFCVEGILEYQNEDKYCFSRSDMPDSAEIHVGDANDLVSETHVILNHYPISEKSYFRSQDCRSLGCLGGLDEWNSYMWDEVWGSLFSAGVDGGGTLGAVLNGNGWRDNILHRDNISLQISTTNVYQFTGNGYALSSAIVRRELPFVIGTTFYYNGGDVENHGELISGEQSLFYDVYSRHKHQFQVHVDFAEKGYQINAITYFEHDETSSRSDSDVNPLISFASPAEYDDSFFNPDLPNLVQSKPVGLTLGGSYDQCIQSVDAIREITLANATGDALERYFAEYDNLTEYPMALGETLLIGSGNTNYDFGLSSMSYNYDVTFNVFEPKFALNYTDISEDGLAGIISIGGYVRNVDWNAATKDASGDIYLDLVNDKVRAQNKLGSAPNETYSCGFEGYFQELNIAPIQTDTTFYFFHSFLTFNANVYTYDVHDDEDNSNTLDLYDDTTSANVKYAMNPFTAFAEVTSSTDSKVVATFRKFPIVTLDSFIDSATKVAQNITPNRETTYIADIDLDDEDKNLFFVDQTTIYNIQPNVDKYFDPTNIHIFNSLEIEISKRLDRLYLEYDEVPIAIFSGDQSTDNDNTGAKIIPDNVYHSSPLPTSDAKAVTSNSNTFYAELSGSINTSFNLVIPFINDNLNIYIDFVPFLVSPRQTTSNFSEILTAAETNSAAYKIDEYTQNGELVYAAVPLLPTTNVNTSVKLSGVVGDELMGSSTKSTGNAVSLDISMQNGRDVYYISDIVEVKIDESTAVEVDQTDIINPKSRLSDVYSTLVQNLFNYMLEYDGTEFITSTVTHDLAVYLVLKEFSSVKYRLLNADGSNPANGKLILDYSGFVARGPVDNSGDLTLELSPISTWEEVKENVVYVSAGTTGEVGFREWDDLNLVIEPDAGYTIASINVYISDDKKDPTDFESESVEVDKDTLFSPIGELSTIKEYDIYNVSRNVWLEVIFREQSRKGFLID